jgi:hypothetical protein
MGFLPRPQSELPLCQGIHVIFSFFNDLILKEIFGYVPTLLVLPPRSAPFMVFANMLALVLRTHPALVLLATGGFLSCPPA